MECAPKWPKVSISNPKARFRNNGVTNLYCEFEVNAFYALQLLYLKKINVSLAHPLQLELHCAPCIVFKQLTVCFASVICFAKVILLLIHIYESACVRSWRIPNRTVRHGNVTTSKAIVADTLHDRLVCKGSKGCDDYFKHV